MHLVFLISTQFTSAITTTNHTIHYFAILDLHCCPGPKVSIWKLQFKRKWKLNLQHLMVSKHIEARAEGEYRKRAWWDQRCVLGGFPLTSPCWHGHTSWLVIVREKHDFQNFLRFWQIPPNWRLEIMYSHNHSLELWRIKEQRHPGGGRGEAKGVRKKELSTSYPLFPGNPLSP